jgi:hypothetical protein
LFAREKDIDFFFLFLFGSKKDEIMRLGNSTCLSLSLSLGGEAKQTAFKEIGFQVYFDHSLLALNTFGKNNKQI